MRVATPAMLEKLNSQYGEENWFVISIDWSGNGKYTYYADKTVLSTPYQVSVIDNQTHLPIFTETRYTQGMDGRILKIENIESILALDGSNTSVSISITLDDSDLSLLNIMNNVDIHLKRVNLYQTFTGLNSTDMLLLFEGHIVSDCVWSDADRTLKLSAVTQFAHYEAGFSPEEGDVADLREDLIGKAWPLVFGSVFKCPCTRITDIPTGSTTSPLAFRDYWLDWQIIRLTGGVVDLRAVAVFFTIGALEAYYSGLTDEGDALTQQANDILILIAQTEANVAALQALRQAQVSVTGDVSSTYVLMDYPINLKGVFEVGGQYLYGSLTTVKNKNLPQGQGTFGGPVSTSGLALFKFDGPYHSITTLEGSLITPTRQELELVGPTQIGIISPQTGVITDLQGAVQRDVSAFRYIPAGSALKFLGNYPVRYVISIVPCTIQNISANRTFESYDRRLNVPKSYYKQVTVVAQSSRQLPSRRFQCTGVRLFRPLSTLLNQHWDDNELYATVVSSIGPDFQSIITYIIRTFTLYDIDTTSLNSVPPFRLNFAILELKDTLTLIKEICFQCKVAASFKNGKFYFTYLPKFVHPTLTLTLNDIIEDTVSLTFTSTENVITKMTGTWRVDWSDPKENVVIIRYNTGKYGTLEQKYDFYCFNNAKAVEASMSFWIFRKGNSWKQLKMKVPLKWLILENYDIINLGTDVCEAYGINGGKVTPATVNNVTYNVDDNTLELLLELPIMLGTNVVDKRYWPSGNFIWLGEQVYSQIYNHILPPTSWNGVDNTPLSMLEPIYIGSTSDQGSTGGITGVDPYQHQSLNLPNEFGFLMNTQNPSGTGSFPTSVVGDYGGTLGDYNSPQIQFNEPHSISDNHHLEPKFPSLYQDPNQKTEAPAATQPSSTFPAQIVSGGGNTYMCDIYTKGLDSAPIQGTVQILQIDPTEDIPDKTWLLVASVNVTVTDDFGETSKSTAYYATIPIWLQ